MAQRLMLVRERKIIDGSIKGDNSTEKITNLISFINMQLVLGMDKDPKLVNILTKSGFFENFVNTANGDTLLTKEKIVEEIAQAVTQNKVAIYDTTDINNMTTNFDAFIKGKGTTFLLGDVVTLSYTGTDTEYIDQNGNKVIESYIFDGTNFKLWTDHIQLILARKEQDKKIQDLDVKKVDNTDVIKTDGTNTFAANYTPNKDTDAETVKSVKDKIDYATSLIKGDLTQIDKADAEQDKRITALEGGGVSAYIKGISEAVGTNQIFTNKVSVDDADDKAFGINSDDAYGVLVMPANVDSPGWTPAFAGSTESFTYDKGNWFDIEVYNKSFRNNGTNTAITSDESDGNSVLMEGQNIYIKLFKVDPRPSKSDSVLLIANQDKGKENNFANYGVGRIFQNKSIAKTSIPDNQDLVDLSNDLKNLIKDGLNEKINKDQSQNKLTKGTYKGATQISNVINKMNELISAISYNYENKVSSQLVARVDFNSLQDLVNMVKVNDFVSLKLPFWNVNGKVTNITGKLTIVGTLIDISKNNQVQYGKFDIINNDFDVVMVDEPYAKGGGGGGASKDYVDKGLAKKQDKLIAGTNISIAPDGKTISATGATETYVDDKVKINKDLIDINTNDIKTLKSFGTFIGTYATLDDLKTARPTPKNGDYGLVGTKDPYLEYIYDGTKSTWEQAGTSTKIDLSNYYKKPETDALLDKKLTNDFSSKGSIVYGLDLTPDNINHEWLLTPGFMDKPTFRRLKGWKEKFATKQNKLTAGTNITIDKDNKISADIETQQILFDGSFKLHSFNGTGTPMSIDLNEWERIQIILSTSSIYSNLGVHDVVVDDDYYFSAVSMDDNASEHFKTYGGTVQIDKDKIFVDGGQFGSRTGNTPGNVNSSYENLYLRKVIGIKKKGQDALAPIGGVSKKYVDDGLAKKQNIINVINNMSSADVFKYITDKGSGWYDIRTNPIKNKVLFAYNIHPNSILFHGFENDKLSKYELSQGGVFTEISYAVIKPTSGPEIANKTYVDEEVAKKTNLDFGNTEQDFLTQSPTKIDIFNNDQFIGFDKNKRVVKTSIDETKIAKVDTTNIQVDKTNAGKFFRVDADGRVAFEEVIEFVKSNYFTENSELLTSNNTVETKDAYIGKGYKGKRIDSWSEDGVPDQIVIEPDDDGIVWKWYKGEKVKEWGK